MTVAPELDQTLGFGDIGRLEASGSLRSPYRPKSPQGAWSEQPDLSDNKDVPGRGGQHFHPRVSHTESLADGMAEVVGNPVPEHLVEGHVGLQHRHVAVPETCRRFEPTDAVSITAAGILL